jgi:hypothetical protein
MTKDHSSAFFQNHVPFGSAQGTLRAMNFLLFIPVPL